MAFHFFHIRYIVILGLNLSPGAVFHMSEKQIMEAFLLSGLVQINHVHYVVAELDFSLHKFAMHHFHLGCLWYIKNTIIG